MYPLDDTIAAVASPPGGAARGIVRISGPRAIECLAASFSPNPPSTIHHSPFAIAGSLALTDLHSPLPCDAYFWPDGRSYTGQQVVEIHTLGSPPLLQMVLGSVCAAGARLAEPGEFTLRAFLAGRIDLTQAEAVLGVIEADDERQLNVALDQLAGGLVRPMQRLRNALLELLAQLEAGFDFADEDLPPITPDELHRRLAATETDLATIRLQAASRGQAADALNVAIVGRPNTGKSSLFNALLGDRAAIVADHPGTTRDYLAAELDLDGMKCRLIDTAGMSGEWRVEREEGWAVHRPLNDTFERDIDQAAQCFAAEQRQAAHIEVLCLDSTRPLDDWERGELADAVQGQRIVVLTKCDAPRRTDCTGSVLETSSATGLGIAALGNELRERGLAAGGAGGDVVAGTALRCAESFRLAAECLGRARRVAAAGREELAAAEIRSALDELGRVVGAVYTEDVLDCIFSRFCIGK